MAVLSLNCLKKDSSPKLNQKRLGEAQNARNLRMYESAVITQQKKSKSISLQIRLSFYFLSSFKNRKGNQMQQKNCINWLILQGFPFNSIFPFIQLKLNYSVQTAKLYTMFQKAKCSVLLFCRKLGTKRGGLQGYHQSTNNVSDSTSNMHHSGYQQPTHLQPDSQESLIPCCAR